MSIPFRLLFNPTCIALFSPYPCAKTQCPAALIFRLPHIFVFANAYYFSTSALFAASDEMSAV